MDNNSDTHIVLGSLRYKSSPDVDYAVKVPLEQTSKDKIEFDRNVNVDLAQVFDNERQSSTIFRPSTKITFLMKNAYSGETRYTPFKNNLYLVNQEYYRNLQLANPNSASNVWGGYPLYNEFDFIRTDYNVAGYTASPNVHVRFLTKNASTYNWVHYLSYVDSSDPNIDLRWYHTPPSAAFLQWKSGDGIPYKMSLTSSNGSNLITLECPVKHGLKVGEYIRFNGLSYNGQSVFEVYSLGNGLFDTDEYYVNLFNYGYLGTTFANGLVGTFKRVINVNNSSETTSQYYVRIHKLLTDVDNAVLVKAGFEQNIFESRKQFQKSAFTPNYTTTVVSKEGNQSYLLSFNKDIDVNGLIDNQKRPVSELFFTIIHRGYFGWFYPSQNYQIREGFSFNLDPQNVGLINIPNNYWDNSVTLNRSKELITDSWENPNTGVEFYYVRFLSSGDNIGGDLCEWNEYEQLERVISKKYYKITYGPLFNIFPVVQTNPPGFFYAPHTPIQIRAFSDYIEESEDKQTDDVPDYAYFSKYRGTFRWRDIYTYGFKDLQGNGVDQPFINGVHYPFQNMVFRLIPEGSNVTQIPYGVQDPIIDGCE